MELAWLSMCAILSADTVWLQEGSLLSSEMAQLEQREGGRRGEERGRRCLDDDGAARWPWQRWGIQRRDGKRWRLTRWSNIISVAGQTVVPAVRTGMGEAEGREKAYNGEDAHARVKSAAASSRRRRESLQDGEGEGTEDLVYIHTGCGIQ